MPIPTDTISSLPSIEELKATLKLIPHPEGGFFAETYRIDDEVASPYADGQQRSLATQIYYLLDSSSSQGRMHLNKSCTFHLQHRGRAQYTLVRARPAPEKPEIKRVILGPNAPAGELLQLIVPGGWWKASELLAEDLGTGEEPACLISEVVTPGFAWEDHGFLTQAQLLNDVFHGDESDPDYQRLRAYVKE